MHEVKRAIADWLIAVVGVDGDVGLPDAIEIRDQAGGPAAAVRVEVENQHAFDSALDSGDRGYGEAIDAAETGSGIIAGVVKAAGEGTRNAVFQRGFCGGKYAAGGESNAVPQARIPFEALRFRKIKRNAGCQRLEIARLMNKLHDLDSGGLWRRDDNARDGTG